MLSNSSGVKGAEYLSLSPTARSLLSVIASVTNPTLCTSLRFTTWLWGFLWTGGVPSPLLLWHRFIFFSSCSSSTLWCSQSCVILCESYWSWQRLPLWYFPDWFTFPENCRAFSFYLFALWKRWWGAVGRIFKSMLCLHFISQPPFLSILSGRTLRKHCVI